MHESFHVASIGCEIIDTLKSHSLKITATQANWQLGAAIAVADR